MISPRKKHFRPHPMLSKEKCGTESSFRNVRFFPPTLEFDGIDTINVLKKEQSWYFSNDKKYLCVGFNPVA